MVCQDHLARLRAIADYQFGRGAGNVLFSPSDKIVISKKTGRAKMVFSNSGDLVVTFRPRDGYLTLGLEGAKRLLREFREFKLKVTVDPGVETFICKGRDLFAKHVVKADDEIRAGDEVLVLSTSGKLLAIGKAVLNGNEMLDFKRGVAVKIRRGCHNCLKE